MPRIPARGRERRFVYGRIFRILHWLVVLCIAASLTLVFSRRWVEEANLDTELLGFHRSVGIVILALTLCRLAYKLIDRNRPYTGISPQIKILAAIAHATLYLFMISLPIIGWVQTSARGKTVFLFGEPLPHLVARSRDLAEDMQFLHTYAAYAFCGLILAHVAAGLWHHFVRRDGVLYSMIPLPQLRRPWHMSPGPDDAHAVDMRFSASMTRSQGR